MYQDIKNIACHTAQTYYKTHKEDIISVCCITFFQKLSLYDPSENRNLTAFMTPYLKEAVTDYINNLNSYTPYYGQQIKIIKNCIKELQDEGIMEVTAESISDRTGISG